MKGCELCGCAARMYCESDQASLCWDCDEKVHGANFLVAKHCRSLLCQVCQCPTPWKASGPKLGPTISICQSCFSDYNKRMEESCSEDRDSRGGNSDVYADDDSDDGETQYEESDDGYDSGDGYYDGDEDDEEEEEEDGENQVVPWSGSAESPVPPLASSSSSDEEVSSVTAGAAGVSKRLRNYNTDHDSEDEIRCFSPHMSYGRSVSDGGHSLGSQRPLKQPRTGEAEAGGQDESRSTAIVGSLRRLQRDMVGNEENASSTILGICRLSRDHHSR